MRATASPCCGFKRVRVLGALLAGGKSRRFGSDKAVAMLGTRSLIAHAIDGLRSQCDGLVLCGRTWPDMVAIDDRPSSGLGPLAGLNAALRHAATAGFDAVLCVPVDVHPLPANLRRLLAGRGARVLEIQHALGFWPIGYGPALDRHLAGGNLSLRSWIASSGATFVPDGALALENVNRPEDLERLTGRLQSSRAAASERCSAL